MQLVRHRDDEPDVVDNRLVVAVRRVLPVSDAYEGGRLATRVQGRRALFFVVSGLLERLVYLSLGLSLVLAFIA